MAPSVMSSTEPTHRTMIPVALLAQSVNAGRDDSNTITSLFIPVLLDAPVPNELVPLDS
jgi:hypothetical protein